MKAFFRQNVGTVDQWLRFSLGFVLLFLAAAGLIGPWGYLGLVAMATAAVRYCPLYHALRIDTGRGRKRKAS